MGKISKNYLYNVAYQILVLLAPIITAPYLARVLGASNLGIYSYVNSSGNIVTTLSLLGIYAYGNRQTAYVRENKEALTSTFWELVALRALLWLIGTVAYAIYSMANQRYSVYFWIYYPYILAQYVDCSWLFVGLEDMKPAVIKNFVTKLVNIGGIFLLVKTKNDLWIYILLLAVSTLLANLSIYTQLPRYIGKPIVDRKMLLRHIRGSVGLFLPQVAALFYLQVDKVMLEWLTGATDQVSFYDQAEKIVTIPLSLITVISTVVMPRLANEYRKNNKAAIQSLLLRAGRISICMAMPMCFGLCCIARKFIPWYLGEEFRPTAMAILILSPIVLLNSLTGISGKQYFTATDQTGILLKAYSLAAVMNVIVNALLIPHWGFAGAAVATVLSSLASVIIQYASFTRQVDVGKFKSYSLRYFLGAILMAAAVCGLTWTRKASIQTTALQILIGGIVYLIYLAIIRDPVLGEILRMLHLNKGHREKTES